MSTAGTSPQAPRGEYRLTCTWVDVFTAGTVILAVVLSRHTRSLYPDSAMPFENIWRQVMEVLAVYEEQGSFFAKRCAWTLQTALEQGLRDTTSSAGHSGEELEGEAAGLRAEGEAQEDVQQTEALDAGDNMLGDDDWWQTGGLAWLDSVTVPENFVTGGGNVDPDGIIR